MTWCVAVDAANHDIVGLDGYWIRLHWIGLHAGVASPVTVTRVLCQLVLHHFQPFLKVSDASIFVLLFSLTLLLLLGDFVF